MIEKPEGNYKGDNNMENMKLSSPWQTFVNEVKALFEEDLDIKIKYSEADYKLDIYCEDARKADALTQLLPTEKDFGNVKLKISVIPADVEITKADLFKDAFAGNPAVEYVTSYNTPFGKVNYVVFRNKVVQFYNDQMDDINGNKSTLFQDIAGDVFGYDHGVFYCTDATKSELRKPLGEWP